MSLKYRIGIGEDIHALKEGRKLILGGVTIPYEKGLLGNSDADIVYHAVSDALLGALSLGDIGHYFPPEDKSLDMLDSAIIVRKCLSLVKEKGYLVGNVDISISAEKPKLKEYLPLMKKNLSMNLEVAEDCVSIKAMTNEGFDAVGEKKAMRATAIVLLYKGEEHD